MASSPISTANDIEPASYCDAGLDETGGVGYGGDCKAVEQTPPPHILDVLEKDERSRITAKWCKQMEGIDDLSSSSSAFESVLPSHIKYSISDVNLSTEAGKLLLVYHAPTTLKSQTSASSNRLWTRNTTITMSDLTTTVGETPLASPAQTSQCALPAEPATVTARPDLTPLETSTVQERATPPVCTHCDLHLQFLHRTFSNPPTLTAIKDPSRWTILPSLNILTAHSTTGEEASCSTPSSSGPGIGGKSTTLSCVRVSETSIAKGAHAPSPTFLSSSPSAPPLSDDHTEQPFLTSRQKITDHYLVRPSTKRHLTDLRAQAILLHLRAINDCGSEDVSETGAHLTFGTWKTLHRAGPWHRGTVAQQEANRHQGRIACNQSFKPTKTKPRRSAFSPATRVSEPKPTKRNSDNSRLSEVVDAQAEHKVELVPPPA
ncbi:hypothetical protein KCU62_g7809, partial [Aureobasidium sp. EXF-3399]